MPVNNTTPNRGYQLPNPNNNLNYDVSRIMAAIQSVDADMAAALIAIAGKAATGHGHLINDVAGLQAALDGKMSASARLAIAALSDVDVSGIAQNMFLRWNGSKWVPVAFDAGMIAGGTVADARLPSRLTASALAAAYAAVGHGHSIAEVSGLQTALDGKAASAHTHIISNVTGLQTALDGKAASAHTHAISDVTGLQTALDTKATNTYVNSQVAGVVSATTTNVLNATAGGSAGQVGTYAFMRITPNTVAHPGETFAGSTLMYAAAGVPTGNPFIYTVGGTWMLMGSTSAADAARSCSLFLRIA